MKKMMAMILLMFSICILLTGCKKPVNPPAPDPDPKPPITEPNGDKDNENGGNNNNDDDGDKDDEETKIPVDEDFNDMAEGQVTNNFNLYNDFITFITKSDFKKKYMNYFEETLKEMRSEGKVLMMSYKGKVDYFDWIEFLCNFDADYRPQYYAQLGNQETEICFTYVVQYVKKENKALLDKGYVEYMKKYGPKDYPLPDNWKEVGPKDYTGVYMDEIIIGGVKTKCMVTTSSAQCIFDFVKDEKIISILTLTDNINEAKEILKDLKLEYVNLK